MRVSSIPSEATCAMPKNKKCWKFIFKLIAYTAQQNASAKKKTKQQQQQQQYAQDYLHLGAVHTIYG